MCKYNTYAIEIIHLNGNRQLRETQNPESYKSTMSLYRQIKENYTDKDVIINFIGLREGEKKIFFTKKNNSFEEDNQNIKELIDTIYESSKELQKRFENIKNKVAIYDKKKSNIDHLLVEAVDVSQLTEEDKAKIFDKLREINLLRRDYKMLNNVRWKCQREINFLVQNSQKILNSYEKNIKINNGKLKDLIDRDGKQVKMHIVKEYPYKSFKHRMHLMKQVEKKYDRVINLSEQNKLVCYNKCYK